MINFAIIGFGHIGKRHAEHILEHKDANLVAICDIDSTTFTHPLAQSIRTYISFEAMLQEQSIDVVCICTPNYLHKSHAILALEANKHVVVEKPMALSTADCETMIAVAQSVNKKIFAVKQNRYNEPVALVKNLMREDKLGKPIILQVNCFWNRNDLYYAQSEWRGKKDKDGGCLFTQFSHFVDIMYYLIGDIAEVQGYIHNYLHLHNTQFEDTGTFSMKASNGTLVNFNFTTCSFQKNMEGSITIIAEKGTVKIGGQYLNTIEYQCIDGIDIPMINITSKSNNYGAYSGSMSNHDKLINNVIEVLKYDKPMTTTAQEARDGVAIIEKMYSAAHG